MPTFLRSLGAIVMGLAIAGVIMAGGDANMLMRPHPVWVWVAAIAGFLAGGHLGTLVARRATAG
jgi:hypothetical protein